MYPLLESEDEPEESSESQRLDYVSNLPAVSAMSGNRDQILSQAAVYHADYPCLRFLFRLTFLGLMSGSYTGFLGQALLLETLGLFSAPEARVSPARFVIVPTFGHPSVDHGARLDFFPNCVGHAPRLGGPGAQSLRVQSNPG
jgi:hypothetical protein